MNWLGIKASVGQKGDEKNVSQVTELDKEGLVAL